VTLSELIAAAGLAGDSLAGRAYTCTDPSARLRPLHEISRRGTPILETHKLASIIDAISKNVPLPPIRLRHPHRLRDGHHRLAVSRALGAAAIPCSW
jgi:hypothetical protein